MSLINISRDIISKAEKEKELISKELETLMSEKELESKERVEYYKKQLKEKNDFDTNSRIKTIKGKGLMDSKKIILDSKTKSMSKTWNEFIGKINNLDDKTREIIISKLINYAKDKINFETIYCSKKDLAFVKNKLKNAKIKSDNINGLIFESKSKEELLNLTFEVIAADIFEKYEDKLQEILFN